MARKRPGLPEDHELNVDVDGLTEPAADIPDFLDMETTRPPVVLPRAEPRLEVVQGRREAPPPPPRVPERQPVEEPRSAPQPQKRQVSQPKLRGRTRPPRKEVGFDDETLSMLKDLHGDGVSQSMEESLTRSEVARAAIRAVYSARNLVQYSSIGPRDR